MITVERRNTVLDIAEEDLDYYMSMGFNQVDKNGKIIKKAIPTSIEELRKAYIEQLSEIESLKAEIKRLRRAKKS